MDLALIWIGAAVVLGVLWWHWSALLTATLAPDLAHAAGANPRREQLVLTLLLAAVVAVALKVVGALLITALLIIPAATARSLTKTPEAMALTSAIIGTLAALGGVRMSVVANTPVGPSIVVVAVVMFCLSLLARRMRPFI
jgi:zinc transport system permease protein